jgi:hypothetical protein
MSVEATPAWVITPISERGPLPWIFIIPRRCDVAVDVEIMLKPVVLCLEACNETAIGIESSWNRSLS